MRINNSCNTRNINQTFFRGVFTTNIKDIDKKYSSVHITDYVDSFQKSVDGITDTYEKERKKAENKFFGKKRALRKLDDEYRGRMDAWRQDQAIFQKAKEAHLKDIERLLETAEKHNATLDELIKLKSDFKQPKKQLI